jgi:hypothetical protein
MRNEKMTPGSLEWWKRLARSSVAGGTEAQYQRVAEVAHRTGCGIWHAAWLVRGQTGRCRCAPCCQAGGER